MSSTQSEAPSAQPPPRVRVAEPRSHTPQISPRAFWLLSTLLVLALVGAFVGLVSAQRTTPGACAPESRWMSQPQSPSCEFVSFHQSNMGNYGKSSS